MKIGRTTLARLLAVLVLGLVTLGVCAPAAGAQGEDAGLDRSDQIVLNGELLVPKGQTLGTAAIMNGPATVEGTVRETLFVLNGRTEISGTVGRDVIVINGSVLLRSGAHVGGDVVSNSAPTIERGARVDGRLRSVATRFDVEGFGFASRFVWWLGYSISVAVLGLLLLLLFPTLDAAVLRAWRDRAGESIGFGALAFFVLPIAAVLFLITIVGIPLGVFILLALALLYTVGYVAGAHVLGRLLVRPPTSRFLAFLAGWAILRAIGLIPVLGGFVWLIASIVGLGVLTVAARRAQAPMPVAAPAPPPPPPASATA